MLEYPADPIPLPTPNIPLLRKAVEWVNEQCVLPSTQRTWKQGTWYDAQHPCGTAYCLAGYVTTQVLGMPVADLDADGEAMEVIADDGEPIWIEDAARQALGLTRTEASGLFWGDNTAADITRYAGHIAARAGQRL